MIKVRKNVLKQILHQHTQFQLNVVLKMILNI